MHYVLNEPPVLFLFFLTRFLCVLMAPVAALRITAYICVDMRIPPR
jgi:hypothetical protein